MISSVAVPIQESDSVRQQNLLACQIAWDALQNREEHALRWFTTGVLNYPPTWVPIVAMALNCMGENGEPKWRSADRPLSLLRTISWRTAFKWLPELLFDRAGPRIRHTYDLEGARPRPRAYVDAGCIGDQRRVIDEDGKRMSHDEHLDQLEFAAYCPELSAFRTRRCGIRRTDEDDPERTRYVNEAMERRGFVIVKECAMRDGQAQQDTDGRQGAHKKTVPHWAFAAYDDLSFRDEDGRDVPMIDGEPVARDVLVPDNCEHRLVIDWKVVGQMAELDGDETTLLEARSLGVTRHGMARHLSWNEHRVQAVWKRLNRKFDDPQFIDRLRDVLVGGGANNFEYYTA